MEQKSTFWKSAMTYGLYLGIILVLYSVITYVIGQFQNTTLGIVSYAVMSAGIYYSQYHYRNAEQGGYISYSSALGFGVVIMIFASILVSLYSIILFKFIDPGLLDQVRILQEEAMLKQGISNDQIEMMSQIMELTTSPGVIVVSGFLGYGVMGLLISLITSIFVKRINDDNAFDETMKELNPEE